jgi:hypothetical protein
MQCSVVVHTNVSEDFAASIFRANTARRPNPEDFELIFTAVKISNLLNRWRSTLRVCRSLPAASPGQHDRVGRIHLETDDSDIEEPPGDDEPRDKRQFVGWPGVLPVGPCFTSKGVLGRCTSFRQCYPYFKLPELSNWETWILGMYDTCSYFTSSGRQVSEYQGKGSKSSILRSL